MYKNSNKNALHEAVSSRDFEAVRHLLANRSPVDVVDDNGAVPLHHAAINGDLRTIHLLRVHGAKGNIYDAHGETPLHLAVKSNDLDSVKEIVIMRPNLDAQDRFGNTALHYAVESESYYLVKFLIESGSTVNCVNENHATPLSLAFKINADMEIISILKKNGAVAPMNFFESIFLAIKTANIIRQSVLLGFILIMGYFLFYTIYLHSFALWPILLGTLGISVGFILIFVDRPYQRVVNLEARFLNGKLSEVEYNLILNKKKIYQDEKSVVDDFQLLNLASSHNDNHKIVDIPQINRKLH